MFAASQLSQVAGAGQVAPVPERQKRENKPLLCSLVYRAGLEKLYTRPRSQTLNGLRWVLLASVRHRSKRWCLRSRAKSPVTAWIHRICLAWGLEGRSPGTRAHQGLGFRISATYHLRYNAATRFHRLVVTSNLGLCIDRSMIL